MEDDGEDERFVWEKRQTPAPLPGAGAFLPRFPRLRAAQPWGWLLRPFGPPASSIYLDRNDGAGRRTRSKYIFLLCFSTDLLPSPSTSSPWTFAPKERRSPTQGSSRYAGAALGYPPITHPAP